MGLREKMNQNPAIATGATAAVIVIALVVIFMQVFGGGGEGTDVSAPVTKAWYTTDDGATFFADDINKVPPFTKDGKEAVGAQVFTCDGGSTKFVAYLERYSPAIKPKLEAARAKVAAAKDGASSEADVVDELETNGKEVKAPKTGNAGWVKQSDTKAAKILEVRCPGGTTENLEPVHPE